MSLLLAPYNNAMRLGQGFNSFTHEILIDDAVTIGPLQPENITDNSGSSARLSALILGKPSMWTKQEQVLLNTAILEEARQKRKDIEEEKSSGEAALLEESEAAEAAAAKKQAQQDNLKKLAIGAGVTIEMSPSPSVRQAEAEEDDDTESEEGVAGVTQAQAAGEDNASEGDPIPSTEPTAGVDTPGADVDNPAVENSESGVSTAEPKDQADSPASPAQPEAASTPTETAKTELATKADAVDKKEVANEATKQKAAKVAALKLKRKQDEVKRAIQRRERAPEMLEAANQFKVTLSLEDMAKMHKKFLMPKSTHTTPNTDGQKTQIFDIQNSTGVSQTVIYQSRFVDKLSDITSDMGVSAGLSIKKSSCGGSGRGSFIDTDKFKSSDMNYYISVKVVNQSINFKDALEFNNIENVGAEEFRRVFGDAFISGFIEGGELNALISMKILNKAKSTDIKAEGSIALGKESLDISAKGAFAKAKANLDLNTETTVQVSWIGGGVIKPPEEAWTIESLARAATRFPDHVATSPGRTYAILTKYDNLRSYQALKPKDLSPCDYENAALYSEELLDLFMSLKALYGRLTTQISEVQSGTLKFKKVEGEAERKKAQSQQFSDAEDHRTLETLTDAEKKARIGFFPSTLDGLDDARQAVRDQMNLIIERVDEITKDPSQVLDNPREKFLPFFAFETLLPMVESAFRTSKRTAPLTGEKMFGDEAGNDSSSDVAHRMCIVKKPIGAAVSNASNASGADDNKEAASTVTSSGKTIKLLRQENNAIEMFLAARDEGVENSLRLTPPMGNELSNPVPGTLFTALDFIQPSLLLRKVTATVTEGVISGLSCKYTNGLSWKRGVVDPESESLDLAPDERITSVIITVGTEAVIKSPEFVLSIKFVTNRGESLIAHEPNVRRAGFGRRFIGKRAFSNVRSVTWEPPLDRGYVSGFWGWSSEKGINPGIFRLGIVWANQNAVDQTAPDDAKKTAAFEADAALEERVSTEEILARNLKESETKLANINQLVTALRKQSEVSDAAAQKTSDDKTAAERKIKEAEQKINDLEGKLVSLTTSTEKTRQALEQQLSAVKEAKGRAESIISALSNEGFRLKHTFSGKFMHCDLDGDEHLARIRGMAGEKAQLFRVEPNATGTAFSFYLVDGNRKWYLKVAAEGSDDKNVQVAQQDCTWFTLFYHYKNEFRMHPVDAQGFSLQPLGWTKDEGAAVRSSRSRFKGNNRWSFA
ncbi:hypothetical protein A4X03_0g2526 [Tilletia caries]|uniref:Jacalin-type lectin domain-containing protein n=1 Tax=Tilletia caries TaxID=13290 RepID=A0A177V9F6_9BASI|nr:hypothetical protein A4X03_0g2526 [Tilletia caries]